MRTKGKAGGSAINKEFDKVFAIMDEAFPPEEFRTYEGQLALLENPYYWLRLERDDQNRLIAFLASWEFEEFRYVEHLAVSRQARGSGIGGSMMQRFLQESVCPVILEVEPPTDDISRRRIGFYQRLGFQLNEFEYMQPPLRKGHGFYPLYVMSYPCSVSMAEFEPMKKTIYREVYGVSGG